MPVSPAQSAALTTNRVTKPANQAQWLTFQISHPDWTQDILLVAIFDGQGVEFDESAYIFEGVQYKPVNMSVTLPSETQDDNGKITLGFARAGTETKKRMSEITPANMRTPKTLVYRRYLEGNPAPVEMSTGFISLDYPKISGQDVQIQSDLYNPSLLTSRYISTLDLYPELKTS